MSKKIINSAQLGFNKLILLTISLTTFLLILISCNQKESKVIGKENQDFFQNQDWQFDIYSTRPFTEKEILKYEILNGHYVYVEENPNGGVVLFSDTKEIANFDGILISNGIGGQVAVTGIENGNYHVTLGVQNKGKWLHWGTISISPDGSKAAFVVMEDGKNVLKVGEEYASSKNISSAVTLVNFSQDSEHWAFIAELNNGNHCVVYDGKQQQEFESIDPKSITLSENKLGLSYAAYSDPTWHIVNGTKIIGKYASLSNLAFSKDGLSYGFFDKTKEVGNIHIDKKTVLTDISRVNWIKIGEKTTPWFMPFRNSRNWACSYNNDGTNIIMLNGEKILQCEEISYPYINTVDGNFRIGCLVRIKEKFYHWIDGALGQPISDYTRKNSIVFSPDGRSCAYSYASLDDKVWHIKLNNKILAKGAIFYDSPVFSLDSKNVASIVSLGKTTIQVLVNGNLIAKTFKKIFILRPNDISGFDCLGILEENDAELSLINIKPSHAGTIIKPEA